MSKRARTTDATAEYAAQLRKAAERKYEEALSASKRRDRSEAWRCIIAASQYDARADGLYVFREDPSSDTRPTIVPPPPPPPSSGDDEDTLVVDLADLLKESDL